MHAKMNKKSFVGELMDLTSQIHKKSLPYFRLKQVSKKVNIFDLKYKQKNFENL